MGFERVIIPSEKELFISQLEGKIISGELPIGSKLPTERELSEATGVSKTVIHFALKELERLRFLRCVPRHGTYINDWTNHGNFETLGAVLKLQGINVDNTLKDSLIRMRNAIESDAMEMCSKYCTEEDYAELQTAIDNLASCSDDAGSEVFARLIFQFHLLITIKSRNRFYPILMNSFSDFSILIWIQCVEYWTKEKIVSFEQLQLDLIKDGKGAQAGDHIKQMYYSFLAEAK